MEKKLLMVGTLLVCTVFTAISQSGAFTPICVPNGIYLVPKMGSPGTGTSGAGNCHAYSLYIAQGGTYDDTKTGSDGFALGTTHGGVLSGTFYDDGYCDKSIGDVEDLLSDYFTYQGSSGQGSPGWVGIIRDNTYNEPLHSFYKTGSSTFSQVRNLGANLQTGINFATAIQDYSTGSGSTTLQSGYNLVWYKKKSGVSFSNNCWNKNIRGCDDDFDEPSTSVSTPSISGPAEICEGEQETYSSSVTNCHFYDWDVTADLGISGGDNGTSVNVNGYYDGPNEKVTLKYKKEWYTNIASTYKWVDVENVPDFYLAASTATPCPYTNMTVTIMPTGQASNITWTTSGSTGTVIVSGQGNNTVTIKPGELAYDVQASFNNDCGGSEYESLSYTTYLCPN